MKRPQLRGPARARLATTIAADWPGLTVRQLARKHRWSKRVVLRALADAGVQVDER